MMTGTEDVTMGMRIGCLITLAAMLFAFATGARAGSEVDPASVSESLRAIFKYGKVQRETVERLNANTVTLMSGTIGGTYVQFGADLASALDDGDNLRVLSIIGRGSVQSVADILFLKGVDLGIVRSDTLDYLEKKGYASNIRKQFSYITKLYNEEMHVVAPKTIRTLSDLEGKIVAVDLPNGHLRYLRHCFRTTGDHGQLCLYRAAARLRKTEEGRNRCDDRGPGQAVKVHHGHQRP